MSDKLNISESKLREMVKESIKETLGEYADRLEEFEKHHATRTMNRSTDNKELDRLINKENGEVRKNAGKNILNRRTRIGAELAADMGPLHRKGSGNREIMNIPTGKMKNGCSIDECIQRAINEYMETEIKNNVKEV